MNIPVSTSATPDNRKLPVTRAVKLTGEDSQLKRKEIRCYFHNTFTLYEKLFDCLASDEAYTTKAIPLRHPLILYYGHTAVFFINKLHVAQLIPHRLEPELESMVAIGVDEMSWDDLDDTHYKWPSPERVKAYRDRGRALVDEFITTASLSLPIRWSDPMWIIFMGIEHERIHLETSSVLIRQLPVELVTSSPLFPICSDRDTTGPTNSLVLVDGGTVILAENRDNELYGWDNEYGQLETRVSAFRASTYLVSNQEYLQFVEAGGYREPEYWTGEGHQWLEYTGVRAPEFWIEAAGTYRYRAMTEVVNMPWSWHG